MKELQRSYTRPRRLFRTPRISASCSTPLLDYYSIANAKLESSEKLRELGNKWGIFPPSSTPSIYSVE